LIILQDKETVIRNVELQRATLPFLLRSQVSVVVFPVLGIEGQDEGSYPAYALTGREPVPTGWIEAFPGFQFVPGGPTTTINLFPVLSEKPAGGILNMAGTVIHGVLYGLTVVSERVSKPRLVINLIRHWDEDRPIETLLDQAAGSPDLRPLTNRHYDPDDIHTAIDRFQCLSPPSVKNWLEK